MCSWVWRSHRSRPIAFGYLRSPEWSKFSLASLRLIRVLILCKHYVSNRSCCVLVSELNIRHLSMTFFFIICLFPPPPSQRHRWGKHSASCPAMASSLALSWWQYTKILSTHMPVRFINPECTMRKHAVHRSSHETCVYREFYVLPAEFIIITKTAKLKNAQSPPLIWFIEFCVANLLLLSLKVIHNCS